MAARLVVRERHEGQLPFPEGSRHLPGWLPPEDRGLTPEYARAENQNMSCLLRDRRLILVHLWSNHWLGDFAHSL
jgi:hypothetical protein